VVLLVVGQIKVLARRSGSIRARTQRREERRNDVQWGGELGEVWGESGDGRQRQRDDTIRREISLCWDRTGGERESAREEARGTCPRSARVSIGHHMGRKEMKSHRKSFQSLTRPRKGTKGPSGRRRLERRKRKKWAQGSIGEQVGGREEDPSPVDCGGEGTGLNVKNT